MKTERRAIGAVGSAILRMNCETQDDATGATADADAAGPGRLQRSRRLGCALALLSVFWTAGPLLAADEERAATAPLAGRGSTAPEAAEDDPAPGPAAPPGANALAPARVLPAAPSGPPSSGPESVPPGMAVDFPVDI